MITSYLLALVATYFPLLLGIGILSIVYARVVRSTYGVAFSLGVACTALGAFGSIYGAPLYYAKYQMHRDSVSRFRAICTERAVVRLPQIREPVLGLVLEQSGQSRASYLSSKDLPWDYLGPGNGLYMAVQEVESGQPSQPMQGWDEDRALTMVGSRKTIDLPLDALPISVLTRKTTGPDDERLGIEGIETIVSRRLGGEVIGRRAVFTRHSTSEPWRRYPPAEVCPQDALKDSKCDDMSGCSVIPFVVSVAPPQPPSDPSKAFHLFLGSGRRTFSCSFSILVGPGIDEKDLVWSADQNEHDAVVFRVLGTNDKLTCRGFFSGGGLGNARKIRFAGSGVAYTTEALDEAKRKGARWSPEPLLKTIQQATSAGR